MSQKNNLDPELIKNQRHDKSFCIILFLIEDGNFMIQKYLPITKDFLHLLNFLTLGITGVIASLLLFLISLIVGLYRLLLELCAYVSNCGFFLSV